MEVIIGAAILVSAFSCPFIFWRYRKYKNLWLSINEHRSDADEKIKFLSNKLIAAEEFIEKYGHITDSEKHIIELKDNCQKAIDIKLEKAKAEAIAIRKEAEAIKQKAIEESELLKPKNPSPVISDFSVTTFNSKRLDDDAQPKAYFNAEANADKAIEHLLGLCNGIASDQHLNDDEIHFLRNWISDNQNITTRWPCNVIHDRITSILSDGIITDDERTDLLETLNGLLGSPVLNGVTSGMSTDLPITPPNNPPD